MLDRVRGRDRRRSRKAEALLGVAREEAVHGEADRGTRSGLAKPRDRFDHRAAGRNDVVEEDRRAAGEIRLWRADANVVVAAPFLREHDDRRAGRLRERFEPLRAFLVGSDEHRIGDVRGDPRGDRPCRRDGHGRDREQRSEIVLAVQVRIDGDEPVERPREERAEMDRAHGLAGLEPRVLAQVGEIRRDEADGSRAELARGPRREEERQREPVGIAQRRDDDDVAAGAVAFERDERFAVREMPPRDAAGCRRETFADAPRERRAAGERQQQRRHGGAPMCTMSRCRSTNARA